MSPLDEIIDGASNNAVTTSNLLRKAKVVADRLGADDIRVWTDRELFGYSAEDLLPEYRSRANASPTSFVDASASTPRSITTPHRFGTT